MCQTCQEVPKIQITNNKISKNREWKTNENIYKMQTMIITFILYFIGEGFRAQRAQKIHQDLV